MCVRLSRRKNIITAALTRYKATNSILYIHIYIFNPMELIWVTKPTSLIVFRIANKQQSRTLKVYN